MIDKPRERAAAVASLALALCLLSLSPATAATFNPTRFDDPNPGKCKQNNCSLREAVTRSNKHDGPDKIVLEAGHYDIELPETAGDDNKGGDFDVIDQVVIAGKGPEETIVDGQDVSRVVSLLTFSKHTLKNLAVEDGSDDNGGGIFAGPAKATLRNVVVRSNTGTESGGGLLTVSQDLKISRSTFVGNGSPRGGAIYMPTGVMNNPNPSGRIETSTFTDNDAELGAGLYLDGADHDVIFTEDPFADVVNATFASNQASVSGGGVAAILGATAHLDNTTVAYNGADVDSSGGGSGGGLFQSSSAIFQIDDVVLAQNTVGGTGGGPQCNGTFIGNGLVAPSAADCTTSATVAANAMIGTLADNGGPTQTIALLAGSPAIDPPLPTSCPEFDQRGRKRDAACDFGSFERKLNDP